MKKAIFFLLFLAGCSGKPMQKEQWQSVVKTCMENNGIPRVAYGLEQTRVVQVTCTAS